MTGRKNIILITVDCLRNDFYNIDDASYPFLNLIHNKSDYFSNCHSLGDNTGTIFPQLLSSTYLNLIPYKKHDKATETNVMCQIAKPRISIAETLKENGYKTYSFQTSPSLSPFFGYDKGFDVFNYVNPHSNSSLPFLSYFYKKPYTDAKKLNEFVKNNELESPFFLWIHYNDVHEPYWEAKFPRFLSDFMWHKYIKRPSKSDLADLNLNSIGNKTIKKFKNLYKKQVEYVDKHLYSLFVESGKFNMDDSLFILTGDHGQALGEHNQWGHGYGVLPINPLSNVPLYISKPNQEVSKKNNNLCSLLDVVPTICDIMDLPILEIYDGVSLLDNSIKDRRHLVWSNTLDFDNSKFLIRMIKDSYIFWQDDMNFKEPRIYDIKNNELRIVDDNNLMTEFKNLAAEHVDYIREKQLKYNTPSNFKNKLEDKLDPKVYDALKALGYV